MAFFYLAHVKITESTATKITIDTNGHGDDNSNILWHDDNSNILWHEEQRRRLTASNVRKIAKRRATAKMGPSVQQLLNNKCQGNSATNWGNF